MAHKIKFLNDIFNANGEIFASRDAVLYTLVGILQAEDNPDNNYTNTALAVIPIGTETINASYIGDDKEAIKAVVIPTTAKTIQQSTFINCNNLTNIVIPDNVTSIGYQAFANCTGLKSVTILGASSMGEKAFLNCSNLTDVIIGNKVTALNIHAFAYCSNLTTVIYLGTKAAWMELVKNINTTSIFLKTQVEKIQCSDGEVEI